VAVVSAAGEDAVERQLDQLIDRLGAAGGTPAGRALLIEARRLKNVVANWRSVPPSAPVQQEMNARVSHLAAAVADMSPGSSWRAGGVHSSGMTAAVAPASTHGAARPGNGQGWSVPTAPHGFGAAGAEETIITDGLSRLPQTPLDVHPVQLSDQLSPHLAMLVDPYSSRADAYRALRHKLARAGDPKVIAVSSAERREGKTTAAINLAASLREGARGRVLLCEANLRAPSIAHALGFTPPLCFNEQLIRHRKDPLEPWVAAEPLAPLQVMAVDPEAKYPPLLDPIAFSIAIDRLRLAGYDYIVVDTPPVLDSADLAMIGDSVDGVLLVAMAKHSGAKKVRRAIEQVGKLTFLGTLLLE
jgi:Mrp family chromosome partitioning ATPase